MNEPMDVFIAVFNQTDEDNKRAKEGPLRRFNEKLWNEHIQPFHDKGIMSIFDVTPNEFQMWYAEIVAFIVNERSRIAEQNNLFMNQG